MINYKITLTPLDWFFFGGETTYEGGTEANYYAESRLFPQQTAIIGMLRYEILKKNGLLNADSSHQQRVKDLIGAKGFDMIDHLSPVGQILNISPILLQRENYLYYKAPLCTDNITFIKNENVYLNGRKNQLPIYVDNKKSCYNNPNEWLSLNPESPVKSIDVEKDVFSFKTKIGITKSRNGNEKNDKDGYYKGKYCMLKSGYSFVFFAQLGTELDSVSLVYLGAERSLFRMEVEKVGSSESATRFWEQIFNSIPSKQGQFLFISDAFVPNKVLELCKFMYSDTIPFRYISRVWQPKRNYASLNKEKEKSGKYNLIRRGSVLFYENEQQTDITTILNNDYLQNFGYNIFK